MEQSSKPELPTLMEDVEAVNSHAPSLGAAASSSLLDKEEMENEYFDTTERQRLIFFERLFYMIDTEGDESVSIDEIERFLSFVAFDSASEVSTRVQLIVAAQERHISQELLDDMDAAEKAELSVLDRTEFIRLCISTLWDKKLDGAPRTGRPHREKALG